MLTYDERKTLGVAFSKLTALSLCTHQLSKIIQVTEAEPGYSEENRKARAVAEKRVL